VDHAFDNDIELLVKVYGPDRSTPTRYSPPTSVEEKMVCGQPSIGDVSTSFVERQNLSMRMGMRRFTRLTNAFSKKVENHEHNVSLYFMHYNFCRVHQTLRVTPAMEAGLTDHVWELEELVGLIG